MWKPAVLLVLALAAMAACSGTETTSAPIDPASVTPPAEGEPDADPGTTPARKDASTPPDPEDPYPVTDAGPKPPANDAGTDAAPPVVCNNVPRGTVTPVAIGGFADLKGGTIVDGRYKATAYKRYINGTSNTTFPPIALGVEIQGNTLQFSSSYGGSTRESFTFTTTGSKMSMSRTCPSPSTPSWYFDAVGDTLTLYGFPGSNSIWYATFQRQP